MKNLNNLVKLIIIPILIFISFFFIYRKMATDMNSLFYYDEYSWVGRGFYFELLLKGDFKNDLWQTYNVDGDPKLSSYLYGLSVYPSYLHDKKNKNKDYDMIKYLIDNNIFREPYFNKNEKLKYDKYLPKNFILWKPIDANGISLNNLLSKYGDNFRKTINIILKARLISVLFLSLTIVLIYFICLFSLKNLAISLIITLLFASSSLVTAYGTVAYSESISLFLTNVAILIAMKIFSDRKKNNFSLVILFGFIISLINQTKLNGILFIIYFIVLSTIYFPGNKFKNIFLKIITVVLVFFTFYIISDPFLYKNPVKNMIFQYQWTYEIGKSQQSTKWSHDALFTPLERLNYINKYFFKNINHGLKPFFLNKPKKISIFIALIKIFLILGLVNLIIEIKKDFFYERKIIFIIFSLSFLSLLFYLMLSWERYLIPLVFPIFYIVGQGILYFFYFIFRKCSFLSCTYL